LLRHKKRLRFAVRQPLSLCCHVDGSTDRLPLRTTCAEADNDLTIYQDFKTKEQFMHSKVYLTAALLLGLASAGTAVTLAYSCPVQQTAA
jgi:hypothetical protein